MKDYLNLGCGSRCHPDWVNVDFVASHPGVQAHNLIDGVPFANDSFSVIYHSHVLEHFGRNEANNFINECFRVLKPGGILRVIVPDLQQLAKQYLTMLETAETDPGKENEANYEWSVIELIDQMVRQNSGGEMLAYWQRQDIINEQLVIERMGNEYLSWKRQYRAPLKALLSDHSITASGKTFLGSWLKRTPKPTISFENSGEKHRWMYDRFSLKTLLERAGFENVRQTDAITSDIPGWDKYQWLDLEDEKIRKPDSLFMEAKKPVN